MPILKCYVDADTLLILENVSSATGRTVEDLAEAAIADAACLTRREPEVAVHPDQRRLF